MAGSEWSKDLLADPPTRAAEWRAIGDCARFVTGSVDPSADAAGRRTLPGYAHGRGIRCGCQRTVAKIGMVPTPWSSAQAVVAIHIEVTAARALRDELVSVDKALAESFGPEIIEQVDDEMLVRYRTDHRSFWRGLSGTFRRDHRAIRGCCRRPGNLSSRQPPRRLSKPCQCVDCERSGQTLLRASQGYWACITRASTQTGRVSRPRLMPFQPRTRIFRTRTHFSLDPR